MQIIKEDNYAFVLFNVQHETITDKFEIDGNIAIIYLKVKSNKIGNTIKMQIGNTVITDVEFINKNRPLQQDGEIVLDSDMIKYNFGKTTIDVKKGDIFEFQQPSNNVSEIKFYFSELREPLTKF
ncbi:MAG: hypothetical protein WDM90_09835 [Ferruginibacter sp.]